LVFQQIFFSAPKTWFVISSFHLCCGAKSKLKKELPTIGLAVFMDLLACFFQIAHTSDFLKEKKFHAGSQNSNKNTKRGNLVIAVAPSTKNATAVCCCCTAEQISIIFFSNKAVFWQHDKKLDFHLESTTIFLLLLLNASKDKSFAKTHQWGKSRLAWVEKLKSAKFACSNCNFFLVWGMQLCSAFCYKCMFRKWLHQKQYVAAQQLTSTLWEPITPVCPPPHST
jgi:hypothetical protein